MTVEELIKKLKKFNPKTEVCLLFDENGWYDIDSVTKECDGEIEFINLGSENAP